MFSHIAVSCGRSSVIGRTLYRVTLRRTGFVLLVALHAPNRYETESEIVTIGSELGTAGRSRRQALANVVTMAGRGFPGSWGRVVCYV